MAPKRARTTRANPDPTRTTTTTKPMTQEAINNLIAQRPRIVRPTWECTYKDYLNCGPLKFNGTKGVIGLTRWGMFPEESDEIERYVGRLPEMIRGNVMSYKPK
nr:hypothetical protein [Tanacetum cinerariifolium]